MSKVQKPQQVTEGGWLLSGPKHVSLCLGRYHSLCIFSSKNLSQQVGSNQHSLADISCWEKELQSCLQDGFPQAPPSAASSPSEFWTQLLMLLQLGSIWLYFGSAVLPAMTKMPCFICWFFYIVQFWFFSCCLHSSLWTIHGSLLIAWALVWDSPHLNIFFFFFLSFLIYNGISQGSAK